MRSATKNKGINEGFTLIEACIAIFIGAIVLSMAITVVFSTQSSGERILQKQEVSQNTRTALSRILKDVASAQSLLRCTVFKSSELQVEYETYIRRIENGGDDPSTTIIETGTPTFSGSSADCLEYYETGQVLLRALPNSLCWFKDLTPSNDQIDYTKPFRASCLFRGGTGNNANYDALGLDQGYGANSVSPMPCQPSNGKGTDADVIYYIECSYTNPNMHYFASNESVYGSWTLDSSSYREVLDLGEIPSTSSYKRKNIFSYTKVDNTTPDYSTGVAGLNTKDIINVDVNMDVRYQSKQSKSSDGYSTYKFSQSVLLQGAKTYSEEGAYSDKFTG
ncbi:MAG: prepilin-type N-terminal cleavage/methylation domain-containing protein [Acidimicrobiia bacterium]